LDKLGLKAQDLAELSFVDMAVPVDDRLGAENDGFEYLTANLAAERLSIALNSQAAAETVLAWTAEELRGSDPGQDTKFCLADCAAQVAAGRAMIDRAVDRIVDEALTGTEAAMAKLYCTELQGRVTSACLASLPPGRAFRSSSRVGQAYLDGRVSRIYGGSSEIMKVITAQHLRL
jgi:long-chain-acyl-CoA dehydrogenase